MSSIQPDILKKSAYCAIDCDLLCIEGQLDATVTTATVYLVIVYIVLNVIYTTIFIFKICFGHTICSLTTETISQS